MLSQIVSEKHPVKVSSKMLEVMFRELLKNNQNGESIMALAFAALVETSPVAFEVLQDMAEGTWRPLSGQGKEFTLRRSSHGSPSAEDFKQWKLEKVFNFRKEVLLTRSGGYEWITSFEEFAKKNSEALDFHSSLEEAIEE